MQGSRPCPTGKGEKKRKEKKANRDSSGHWNRTRFHHDQAETAGTCCWLGVNGCAVEDELLVTKNHWKINLISSILCWCRILVGKEKLDPSFLRFLICFFPPLPRLSLRMCHYSIYLVFLSFLVSSLRTTRGLLTLLGRTQLFIYL